MEITLEKIKEMFKKYDIAALNKIPKCEDCITLLTNTIKNENILNCHTIGFELDEESYNCIENLCLINGIMYIPKKGLYVQDIEHLPSYFSRFGKEIRKYGKFKDEDSASYLWFLSEFEGLMILQRTNNFGEDIIIQWKEGCSEGNPWTKEGRIIYKFLGEGIVPLDLDNEI